MSSRPLGGDSTQRIDTPADFSAAFGVSRETIQRLETYAGLLQKWQKTINLVAPRTVAEIWHRHFADSAQLWAYVPQHARTLVDLGSGAGFPGLVLAILAAGAVGAGARAPLRFTLIESDTRKAAFLREAARAVGIAVDIIPHRIESEQIRAMVERIDCVTSRALAPLPRLLELAYPLFGPETVGVFPKGRDASAEVEAAEHTFEFRLRLEPSLTEADARIVVIERLKLREGS
ncbi:MAG: 16S rRNA (guanine(527)-N(7))-methyltransferase RsmG [Hyphomicrobiaceae bacterium]|nr:16S rRNA (guanine(527)-N(7))-methyltransferase RsmG [Hyphomicrobiaceae bacterium]